MLLRSHAGYALGQLHQVFSPGRALLCRLFFNIMWAFFKLCRPTRPLTQAEPSPSDGQHACSRLSPLALDWSFEEQATFTLPPCALWEAATWFGWCLFEFLRRCFQLVFYIQCYSDIFNPFVADRRATARTTETLSHAASSLKKNKEFEPEHVSLSRLLIGPVALIRLVLFFGEVFFVCFVGLLFPYWTRL